MPDERMNYNSMDKMAAEFKNAATQIEQSMSAMKKLVGMMEGGALVGMGGEAFREAINGKLLPRMNILKGKMTELERDIKGAVSATRDGVKTAQSRFK
jgi:uncharacterized protein YukE